MLIRISTHYRVLCRVLGAALLCLAADASAQTVAPRSASDILSELKLKDAVARHRAGDAEAARATLAQPEPAPEDAEGHFRQLRRRAHAHAVLGDREGQKRELQRALQAAGDQPVRRYVALGALGSYESNVGSRLAAREHFEAQLELARTRKMNLGWHIDPLFGLVAVAWRLGDRPAAERAVAELEQTVDRSRRDRFWEEWGHLRTARLEAARYRLHELRGDLPAAEQAAQTALAEAERHLAKRAERVATAQEREEIQSHTEWIESIARDLAYSQTAQGKLLAAELSVRKALELSLKRTGFVSVTTVRSLQNFASTLVEQGRYVEGEAIAREALRAASAAGLPGTSEVLVFARGALGSALAMQGRWGEAVRVFAERESALAQADPELRKAMRLGSFNWALALIKTGQHLHARNLLAAMRVNFESYGDSATSLRVVYTRGFAGLSYVEAGEPEKALEEFRASVPHILEAAYRDLREDREGPARIARMNYVLEGYMRALAEVNRARPGDAAGEIFRIADFARGSRVQRALSLGAGRVAARDPALAKLVEEDERLLDRVTVLSGIVTGLAAAPEEKRLDRVINQMRADLTQIEQTRSRIRERIAAEFPDYAALVAPKPVSLDDAQRSLRPGEALLSIYLAEDRAYVWGVPREGQSAFAVVSVPRSDVAATVAELRKAFDVGEAAIEQVRAFDIARAHALYVQLVRPVEAAVRGATVLVVAPHGALGQLPFALLPTASVQVSQGPLAFEGYRQVPWLLRRHAIVQVPAVSSLVTLARLPAPPAGRKVFLGFGDPLFGNAPAPERGAKAVALRNLGVLRSAASASLSMLPPLPDTREELLEIARTLKADAAGDVFLGAAANEKAVRSSDLASRRVVAFATHGLVPGDLDGLAQPALALSHPVHSGGEGDGLLTLEEILALRMNADWVVLSACNTGAASGAGEEAVSGLGRAFFFAGARALLASNWPVETVSARLLTTDLFRRQAADAKLSRGEALREAMLGVLDREVARDASGKPAYTYAHPIFWAAFSLVGDGGR